MTAQRMYSEPTWLRTVDASEVTPPRTALDYYETGHVYEAVVEQQVERDFEALSAAERAPFEAKESAGKQLHKFTDVVDGERAFVKSKKTKLEAVDPDLAARIAAAFGRDGYGASLPKVGWRAREWDEGRNEELSKWGQAADFANDEESDDSDDSDSDSDEVAGHVNLVMAPNGVAAPASAPVAVAHAVGGTYDDSSDSSDSSD